MDKLCLYETDSEGDDPIAKSDSSSSSSSSDQPNESNNQVNMDQQIEKMRQEEPIEMVQNPIDEILAPIEQQMDSNFHAAYHGNHIAASQYAPTGLIPQPIMMQEHYQAQEMKFVEQRVIQEAETFAIRDASRDIVDEEIEPPIADQINQTISAQEALVQDHHQYHARNLLAEPEHQQVVVVADDEPNSNTMSAEDAEDLGQVNMQHQEKFSEENPHSIAMEQQQMEPVYVAEEPKLRENEPAQNQPSAFVREPLMEQNLPIVEQQDIIVNLEQAEPQQVFSQEEQQFAQASCAQFSEEISKSIQIVADSNQDELQKAQEQLAQQPIEAPKTIDIASESSELDQRLLREQESDQDFSGDEQQAQQGKDAFEEGSEDMNMIAVTNPILFTEHVPIMGRVPLMFFLPDVEESKKLKELIEAHGGRCIEQFECGSYQIRTNSKTELDFNNFYKGELYDEQWIRDSVLSGILIPKTEYALGENDSDEALKLNIGKRKRITIVEGICLYKLLGAKQFEKVTIETFKGIERQRYLPERSIESMKSFWKEFASKTLEQYLVEAIFYKWDYCLSFKEIPNEEFETKHRQQFAYEFGCLELQNHQNVYNQQQQIGDGALPFSSGAQMDGISSDSDDIFNDKMTDQIDQINANQKNKFSALDQLTSPGNNLTGAKSSIDAQLTGSTLLNSAQTDGLNDLSGSKQTSMINTQAKAFDAGVISDQRIDLSALIDDGNSSKVQQPVINENIPKMKPVNTKGLVKLGQKRTYSNASSLCFNQPSRPSGFLANAVEQLNRKRFKRYAPRHGECALWNPKEIEKYLDIETMEIRVNESAFEKCNHIVVPKFYRTIVRKPDEDGRFKWIQLELEEMANEYSKTLEEVLPIFAQVNCDKKRLRDRLQGNSYCIWRKIEDVTLQTYFFKKKANGGQEPPHDAQYQCLVDEKGPSEIAARNNFLGLVL